jgi:hypothetical protein
MVTRTEVCSDLRKGCSFAIEEHLMIQDWARRNDHRAAIHLDHGVEDEEYEEAVMLLFGVNRRCRFILWRTQQAVFVQPLIGRRQQYTSVRQALEGALLNRDPNRSREAARRPSSCGLVP